MYSISKLKTFRGMDGQGFNLTLIRNGRTVAFVMNEGSGGPTNFEWADAKAPSVTGKFRKYDDTIVSRVMTPEEAKWEEFVIGLPQYKSPYHNSMKGELVFHTNETYIEDLMVMARVDERLKKMFRDSVVMILDGRVASIKLRPGAQLATVLPQVKVKYPTAKILNELTLSEALILARPLMIKE